MVHAQGLYTDPEILALEREKLFGAEWICLGRADELPQPGDFINGRIDSSDGRRDLGRKTAAGARHAAAGSEVTDVDRRHDPVAPVAYRMLFASITSSAGMLVRRMVSRTRCNRA